MKSGLYDINNKLIFDWNDLLKYGFVTVDNNVLTNIIIPPFDIFMKKELYLTYVQKQNINEFIQKTEKCFKDKIYNKLIIDDSIKIIDFERPVNIPKEYEGITFNDLIMNIPSGVTNIVYGNKTGIKEINVNVDNPYFSSENGVLYNKNKTTLIKYPNNNINKKFVIPNSVTKVCDNCFHASENLEEIVMNDNVKELGMGTFSYCYNLKQIKLSDEIKRLEYLSFAFCLLQKIKLPKNLEFVSSNIFLACSELKQIVYPGTKENFDKIYGIHQLQIHKYKIEYHKTLDDLLNEGKSLANANEILKTYEQGR